MMGQHPKVACPQCGTPLERRDRFCGSCGSPIGGDASALKQPPPTDLDEGQGGPATHGAGSDAEAVSARVLRGQRRAASRGVALGVTAVAALAGATTWFMLSDQDAISARVGPEGAVIDLPAGGSVTFPSGALDEQATVTIRPAETERLPNPPPTVVPVGAAVEVELHGATLMNPASIELPFDGTSVPDQERGTVFMATDDATGRWTGIGAEVDWDRELVSAPIDRFSVRAFQPFGSQFTPGDPAFAPYITHEVTDDSEPAKVEQRLNCAYKSPAEHGCYDKSRRDYHTWWAIDFKVPAGPREQRLVVRAAGPGIVHQWTGDDQYPCLETGDRKAACGSRFGNWVAIKHDSDPVRYSLYAHLLEIWVRPGQRVTTGQALGLSGDTGTSSGHHIHYEERPAAFGTIDSTWRAEDPGAVLAFHGEQWFAYPDLWGEDERCPEWPTDTWKELPGSADGTRRCLFRNDGYLTPVAGKWTADAPVASVGFHLVDRFHFGSVGGDQGSCLFGEPGDVPLAGDWNEDGVDAVGVYRPFESEFLLATGPECGDEVQRHKFGSGMADPDPRGPTSQLLPETGRPIVGDWNGDGRDNIGLFRDVEIDSDKTAEGPSWFHFDTSQQDSAAGSAGCAGKPWEMMGDQGDLPLVGNWDGLPGDGIGIMRVQADTNLIIVDFDCNGKEDDEDWRTQAGQPGDIPLVADFDGDGRDEIALYRLTELRIIGIVAPTAPASPPVVALEDLAWSRVVGDDAFETFTDARAVTAGGPGFVAVGKAGDDAAVWTSTDGRSWARVPHQAALADGDMYGVTAGGPGLVAVGYDRSGRTHVAAVWTSPDGTTWSQVPHDEALFGRSGEEQSEMSAVTTGGDGLVAVGSLVPTGRSEDWAAVVWRSVDGHNWMRVPHDEAIFGNSAGARGVSTGGPGFVAVGWGDGGPAVWTSADGTSWSRVSETERLSGSMGAVAEGGPGLVAVGSDSEGAAVWTSPDGISWTRVPHDDAVFGGPRSQTMYSVSAGDGGLVAVGDDYTLLLDPENRPGLAAPVAAVWTSPDGVSWSRVPHDKLVFGGTDSQDSNLMRAVTASGRQFVAVGLESRRSRTAIWIAEPAP